MYKIVIIDDEPIISKGLKLIIERSKIECQVIGIAHDGKDGIHMIKQLNPDIVLTDISMLEMDGLEMISQLQNSEKLYQFIILSGFSEFEYAKKAMSLSVKHFITKPVEEEELYFAIRDSIDEIEKMEKKAVEIKTLKDIFITNQTQMKNQLLRDLLVLADESKVFMDYFLPSDFFPKESKSFVCVLFQFSKKDNKVFVKHYDILSSTISNSLSSYISVNSILLSSNQIAVVIAHDSIILPETLYTDIQTSKDSLSIFWAESVAVGIGLIYPTISDISRSFDNARHAIEFQIIWGANSVISFEETMSVQGFDNNEIIKDIALLQGYIKQMDEDGALKTIDKILEILVSHQDIRPQDLQLQILSILLSSIQNLSMMQFQLNDFLGKDIFSLKTISKFNTIEEMKNWLKNIIRSIIVLRMTKNDLTEKNIITEITAYISQNYNQEINLNLLAEKFYINPYYLSHLFKEKTGESYLNYLTNLRINKAKYLLEKTNIKIYEIALQVGYNDTSYFSKLFERNTGTKPSQYRKQRECRK